MRRLLAFMLLAGLALFSGCTGNAQPAPVAPPHTAIQQSVASAGCTAQTPTTARGYTTLWSKLPVTQWGGGDVSISVKIGARTVWLYGDTLSTGRFEHSTAIVQTAGCLHVSHGGAQLLPNSGLSWYWIAAASADGPTDVKILAESVHRTGSGVWSFAVGTSRYALASLNSAGDLTFSHWLTSSATPAKPVGTLLRVGYGHLEYGQVVHHDIRLADGHYLLTICQNWDDGKTHPLQAYAPIFGEA